MFETSRHSNIYEDLKVEDSEDILIDDLLASNQNLANHMDQAVTKVLNDLLYPNMRALFCVPFQHIDMNEIIIKRLTVKTGPVKVQAVSLPFNRD